MVSTGVVTVAACSSRSRSSSKGTGLAVRGAQGRADGGEAVAVFREDGVVLVQMQGLHKPLAQARQEVKGTAQKDNRALELPALGQAGHRLVHHRLKDGGGHVLLAARPG